MVFRDLWRVGRGGMGWGVLALGACAALTAACGTVRPEGEPGARCEPGEVVAWDELELASLKAGAGDDALEALVVGALGLAAAPDDEEDGAGVVVGAPYPLFGVRWVPVAHCEPGAEGGGGTRPCTLWLVRVEGDRVTSRAELVYDDVGLQVQVADLVDWRIVPFDVDGDGVAELMVETTTEGESLPAVGPLYSTWMSVVATASGEGMWTARVASEGAGAHPTCRGTLTFEDADCDGRRELRLRKRCWPLHCWEAADEHEEDAPVPCADEPMEHTDERFACPEGERLYRPLTPR